MHDATAVCIVQTLLLIAKHKPYHKDLIEVVTEVEVRKTKIKLLQLITATDRYLEIL